MIPLLMIKGIASLALVAALAGGGYATYSYIKGIGYQEAKVECELRFKEYNDTVATKIATIEANSTLLVENNKTANELLIKDVTGIVKSIKGKTLTVVKNGECLPNQTFSDTINSVNKRVNQSINGQPK